ncbi:MAG TPA: class I SAM-dependent methyltransferase [Acidimicrobiales bacterium]
MSHSQYHFDPSSYEAMVTAEVPGYHRLQAAVAEAASACPAARILDLGTGTGATARAVLAAQPNAQLVGVDESTDMLAVARRVLPASADLRVGRLQDPLPAGPFDVVVSALAVHHLDRVGKADLFRRVADVLVPGGRFVLGDVIEPVDPADVVTPIDGVFDQPSPVADQLAWLADAGLDAEAVWVERDVAVLVGVLPLAS